MKDPIVLKDARSLSPQEQEEQRKKAVRAVLSGKKITEVAEIFGVSRQSVTNWMREYRREGTAGLKGLKRGHAGGEPISPEEKERLIEIMITRTPNQAGLPFALWTRRAVAALIKRETGVIRSRTSVGRYLKRWGFTPQRPKKKAYEQNPQAVKAWVETEYVRIRDHAREENADIFFCG